MNCAALTSCSYILLISWILQCYSLDNVAWDSCPTDESGVYLRECAFLPFPLNRDSHDISQKNVTSFIRRYYFGDKPTEDAVWYVNL